LNLSFFGKLISIEMNFIKINSQKELKLKTNCKVLLTYSLDPFMMNNAYPSRITATAGTRLVGII